jgi:hypothetical protein
MRTRHPCQKQLAKLLTAAALTVVSLPSQAGWVCTGHVRDLQIDPNGTLYMSLFKPDGAMVWQHKPVCSLSATVNNMNPAACKGVHSTLVLSVVLKRSVTFWFDFSNTKPADCSPARFPPWQWLAAGGDDWYFGPKLDE